MNVLNVHRQSPDTLVTITCERCVTAWRPANPTMQELGATIDKALGHVCDPDRTDVARVLYGALRGSA